MNSEPARSLPCRRPGRSGLAAAGAALAVTLLLGRCGRAEDDWIVDDAELTALEAGPGHMMHGGNLQDLQANFDANILGLFGPVHHQQRIRHRFIRGGGKMVVVGNGAEVQPAVNGQQSQTAPAADASGESPVLVGLKKSFEPELTRLDRDCGLSAEQHRLLQLALESDLRRVAEDVDRDRRKYIGETANLVDQAGQQKWNQLHQDIQRCRQVIQRFGQGADSLFLFWKARDSVLTAPQRTKADAETEARLAGRWKAVVNVALTRWDEVLGLDRQQFDELERLLLEKRPSLRANSGTLPGLGGGQQLFQMSQPLAGMVLADIGEQRIRKVVNDRQWALLHPAAQAGRQMRPHLEQQGLLETVKR